MKQHFTTITAAAALLLNAGACTTENYYRSANVPPELTASVDLDGIDTFKTSAVSDVRTFTMSITATDENKNMNMLLVSTPTGSCKIGGEATDRQAIEAARERGEFTRSIEFTPNQDGLHTITARVVDDFNTSRSIEKRVFSFTNMRPKVNVTYGKKRTDVDAIAYLYDFSASYDQDAQWGGKIDTMYV